MVEKIEKTLTVPLPREAAFDLFARQMSRWWPLARHSFAPANHSTAPAPGPEPKITVEPFCGGRICEETPDGAKATWATITDWTPGHRLSFEWYAGRGPDQATSVAVTFTDDGAETRVHLVHDGFDRLGTSAATPGADSLSLAA